MTKRERKPPPEMQVVAVREPDARWRQMKRAWDACEAAGLAAPKSVERFFNNERPDPDGVVVDLNLKARDASTDSCSGIAIAVADVPDGCTIIRVTYHH